MKKVLIKNNYYKDSITLMAVTNSIKSLDNVKNVSVSMATEMNKDILKNIGFSGIEIDNASETDMIIAVETDGNINDIVELVEKELNKKNVKNTNGGIYENTAAAINDDEDINLAIISIPGNFAYREVKRCLDKGINVMLFSDNVPIEEEKSLKEYAVSKDLLMMGPDCGTSIINDTGICFANKIKTGNIGIIGASGTGLQEVSVLINNLGYGISNAIGVGGRDLSEDIGGIMTLKSIDFLENDKKSDMIIVISKPPSNKIAKKIIERMTKIKKKKLICFINGNKELLDGADIPFEITLEDTAYKAVNIIDNNFNKSVLDDSVFIENISKNIIENIENGKKKGKYLRALYCGGTLASETDMLIRRDFNVFSNVTKNKDFLLKEPFSSKENTIIDLGDDYFTRGKAHPMIDPTIRNSRIIEEAKDKEVALLLLDFELGYGSNDNPAGIAIESINIAKKIAEQDGRRLVVIGYILGTEYDKQDKNKQEKMLKDNGVFLANSNAQASRIAKNILKYLWSER